jgi:hypothetical protein
VVATRVDPVTRAITAAASTEPLTTLQRAEIVAILGETIAAATDAAVARVRALANVPRNQIAANQQADKEIATLVDAGLKATWAASRAKNNSVPG